MKKTVAVILLLTTVTVFFCTSVFGASVPSVNTYKNYNVAVQNVTLNISAQALYPYVDGSSMAAGESLYTHWNLIITVSFKNDNDTPKLVSDVYPSVQLNVPSTPNSPVFFDAITDVINYSDDMQLVYDGSSNRKWTLIAGDNYSYNGGIVIPPHKTLYAICVCSLPAVVTSGSSTYSTLNSVSSGWAGINNTTYNPGANDSDILQAINSLSTYLQTTLYWINYHDENTSNNTASILVTENNIYSYLQTMNSGLSGQLTAINNNVFYTYNNVVDIKSKLNDIYTDVHSIQQAMTSNSSTNASASQDSQSLKTQSDSVHQQEQQFFNQNSQAIAATGLSNYSFGVNGNGVTAVSKDFTDIFNSLGDWNSVYIFSLTLGLALTIIRHVPSAVSRRRRNKESE